MASNTPYIPKAHAAVGAVTCPYCNAPAGTPCIPGPKAYSAEAKIGTHLARVRRFQGTEPARAVST